MRRALAGATEWSSRDFRSPAGGRIQSSRRTGGLHHRLMSNVPSGQLAVFPALTLDMQCVLVGLRSKTSLNTCATGGPDPPWLLSASRGQLEEAAKVPGRLNTHDEALQLFALILADDITAERGEFYRD